MEGHTTSKSENTDRLVQYWVCEDITGFFFFVGPLRNGEKCFFFVVFTRMQK